MATVGGVLRARRVVGGLEYDRRTISSQMSSPSSSTNDHDSNCRFLELGRAARRLDPQRRRRDRISRQRVSRAGAARRRPDARTDGFVSLGMVVSAIVVALGVKIADPIVGLVITLIILHITWESWHEVTHAEIDLEHVDDH